MAATPPIQLPPGFLAELSRATSRRDVLGAVARWMPDIIPVGRASISVPRGDTDLVVHAIDHDLGIFVEGAVLPIDGSLIGRAFESLRPQVEADLRQSDADEAPYLVEAGLRSALVQPLVNGSRSLGTINMAHAELDFFNSTHVAHLGSIAALLAAFLAAHETAATETRRANTDALTQCLSRQAVLDELDRSFLDEPEVALLYIDVNKFKAVNDTHGHLRGDAMLRILADRIRGVLGSGDQLGRLGGDEFLIIAQRDEPSAERLARQVADVCAMPIRLGPVRITPEVSIGVATPTESTDDSLGLLHDADQAMYSSKKHGHAVTIADGVTRSRSAMISTIDRDLDAGLDATGITMHLQPVRALHSRQFMGSEALVRWMHPRLGPIPAPLLVERLETTGRTAEFTRWTIETAARLWKDVRSAVPWLQSLPVAINLTPRQLAWQGCVDAHREITERYGLHRRDLVIEVVESGEIRPGDLAETTLKRLGEEDVGVALDDFGVGYNALAYFARFPIQALKFDRSLVSLVADHADVRTILHGLTAVSHDLGAFTIAEGIETEEEARICRDLGIAMGQGWHLGHPTSVDEFIAVAIADGPPPGFDDRARGPRRYPLARDLPRQPAPRERDVSHYDGARNDRASRVAGQS